MNSDNNTPMIDKTLSMLNILIIIFLVVLSYSCYIVFVELRVGNYAYQKYYDSAKVIPQLSMSEVKERIEYNPSKVWEEQEFFDMFRNNMNTMSISIKFNTASNAYKSIRGFEGFVPLDYNVYYYANEKEMKFLESVFTAPNSFPMYSESLLEDLSEEVISATVIYSNDIGDFIMKEDTLYYIPSILRN